MRLNDSVNPWHRLRRRACLALRTYPEALLLSAAFALSLAWQEPTAQALPSLRDLPSSAASGRQTFLRLHGLEAPSAEAFLPVDILGLERARTRRAS